MTSFTPFRYLFLDLRTCIGTKLLCFVSECSTYSLSLPCMRLDQDSGQVMKFVYMRTTCSVCILNMWLKLKLNLLKQLIFILLCLFLICAEYELETLGATSDEIRLMALYLNPDIIDVSLKTWVSTSDEFGRIPKDFCLNCTENELQTCLSQIDGSRVITHLSATSKTWNNFKQSDENCVLAFDILLICSD